MSKAIKRFNKKNDFLNGNWSLYDLQLKSTSDGKPRHMVIACDPTDDRIIPSEIYNSISRGLGSTDTVFKVFTSFKVNTESIPLASLFIEDGSYWRSGFFNHEWVEKYMLVPVTINFKSVESYSPLDIKITPDELNIIQSIKDGVAAKKED